jgi:mono/diheme cytochrome c family protein
MKERLQVIALAAGALGAACSRAPADLEAGAAQLAAAVAASPAAQQVERGRYLASHVALCSDCHSPRLPDGSFDPERWLSGVDCFVDVVPSDPAQGCLNTKNLTAHPTGLLNRSDREIKDMMLKGERADGKALHPFMPYAFFGNMSDSDADAIVAYLREVPGVEHRVGPSQPPFLPPPVPVPRVPEALIPVPRADYSDPAAALRGRYLAGNIGACMDCHTPRAQGRPALERAFQGGMSFRRELLGLPADYPELIYAANLTPHATGIADYGVADVVRALRHGEDKDGGSLCPPMPAGPLGALAGLSEADASDIGHYLLSLPPAENVIPVDCRPKQTAVSRHGH